MSYAKKADRKTLKVLISPTGDSARTYTAHPDGTIRVRAQNTHDQRPMLLEAGEYSTVLRNTLTAKLLAAAATHATQGAWETLAKTSWNYLPAIENAADDLQERCIAPSNIPTKDQPTASNLTQVANHIIRTKIAKPKTMTIARQIFGKADSRGPGITTREYNEAALNHGPITALQQTAPQIAELYIKRVVSSYRFRPNPAGHQGEILARTKRYMNMPPSHWKQLCRLAAACPDVTGTRTTENLRTICRALADVNRPEATPDKLRHITQAINHHEFYRDARWQHGDPWKPWITLLNQYFRTDLPGEHNTRDFEMIVDALRSHIQSQEPWGPGDWATLLARSERWHNRVRERRPAWSAPAQALATAWESTLPETAIGDFVFTPVTTGRALAALGETMGNCLATFWDRCQSGHSRIFTVRETQAEKHTAAAEIQRDGTAWRGGQLEGHHRRPVSEAMREAVAALPALYQKADRKSGKLPEG